MYQLAIDIELIYIFRCFVILGFLIECLGMRYKAALVTVWKIIKELKYVLPVDGKENI